MEPTSRCPGLPVLIFTPAIWDGMSRAQRRRLMHLAPAVFLKKPLEEALTSNSAAVALGYWLVPAALSN